MSLWHLEHMFIVVALPKNPQLLMQSMGPSGAWHPVSFEDSIYSTIPIQNDSFGRS